MWLDDSRRERAVFAALGFVSVQTISEKIESFVPPHVRCEIIGRGNLVIPVREQFPLIEIFKLYKFTIAMPRSS